MGDIPTLPNYMFEPNIYGLLSFIAVWLLPILAGLLTKQSWRPSVKGWVLFGLAFVKTVVEAIIAGRGNPHFSLSAALYTTLGNLIIAVALYYTIIRGSRIQEAVVESGVK